MRITSSILVLFGLLFALLGVAFWTVPDLAGTPFALEPVGLAGVSTLRADLGGMFLALAALTLGGVLLRRRWLLTAAGLMLTTAAAGRGVGWAITGSTAGLLTTLPVEIGGALTVAAHLWLSRGVADDRRPARAWLALAGGVALVLAAVAGATVGLQSPKVQDALFSRYIERTMAQNSAGLLKDDALRVALCGTSAPLPSPHRAKACVAVMAGGRIWIVDSGPESTKTLLEWSLPLDKVAGVLITHFHSDHIGDLGELNLQTWVAGRPSQLPVYGGPGVERLVAGFNEAYALDHAYRTAHHTAAIAPPATGQMVAYPVPMPETGPRTAVVFDDGKLKITAIETNHAPVHPAYSYRFDYRGRSVVVTGDTTEYAPLTQAARGADILVAEGMNRELVRAMEKTARTYRPRVAHIMADIQSYHMSPTEAADMANRAGVKLLVIYHQIPPADNALARSIYLRGMDTARRGAYDLADDGSLYTLPLDSQAFHIGRVTP